MRERERERERERDTHTHTHTHTHTLTHTHTHSLTHREEVEWSKQLVVDLITETEVDHFSGKTNPFL